MTSVGQQLQAQGLSLLNMENKQRQQPKIAHEHGAGSQCLKCGPKCSGFDLHFWRKICKNCRCVKENHLVPEDDVASRVVGQLFDDSFQKPDVGQQSAGGGRGEAAPLKVHIVKASPASVIPADGEPGSPLDWVPPAAEPHLALKYMEQLPADQQPIVGSQAAVERKRALERQLPSHDLDPDRCQSLSANEKRMMEDYVKQMKQFVVGQGLIQECPPRGQLPPAPPQLDRILEQKVSQINLQAPNARGQSPSTSPKPARSAVQFVTPKPYVRFEDSPSTTSDIRKMSLKPNGGGGDQDQLPPPPPEMLQDAPPKAPPAFPPPPPPPPPLTDPVDNSETIAAETAKPFDPVRDFFDFLDEQEGKKLPGKLKSPFLPAGGALRNLNTVPRPYQPDQRRDPVASQQQRSVGNSPAAVGQRPSGPAVVAAPGQGGKIGWPKAPAPPQSSIHQAPVAQAAGRGPPPQQGQKPGQQQARIDQVAPKVLLTTDFDYTPEPVNNNETTSASVSKLNNNPSVVAALNNNLPDKQKDAPPAPPAAAPQQAPVKYEQEIFELPEHHWHCHKCRHPIQAGTVAVFAERAGSDKCWHPQCFCCSICNERLADLIYFFVDGELFCGRHYSEKMNIPRCKACDELIFATEYTQADGASWHMNHFCCWLCDTPLAGKQYTPVNEQPHCLDCYQKKYGKNCHECKKPILATERLVSHAEWAWHDSADCFKCRQCSVPMADRTFVWKNEQVYCSRDCFVQHNQPSSQQQQAKVILIP